MFAKRRPEPRIEPNFVVVKPTTDLRFHVISGERWSATFTRDGETHPYFANCLHASSVFLMVLEGIRRLAASDPGIMVTVVDDAAGTYTDWVTKRHGRDRDTSKLPRHRIVTPA